LTGRCPCHITLHINLYANPACAIYVVSSTRAHADPARRTGTRHSRLGSVWRTVCGVWATRAHARTGGTGRLECCEGRGAARGVERPASIGPAPASLCQTRHWATFLLHPHSTLSAAAAPAPRLLHPQACSALTVSGADLGRVSDLRACVWGGCGRQVSELLDRLGSASRRGRRASRGRGGGEDAVLEKSIEALSKDVRKVAMLPPRATLAQSVRLSSIPLLCSLSLAVYPSSRRMRQRLQRDTARQRDTLSDKPSGRCTRF
jgi:hypothetical protein